jgi:hypothetical protein
MSDQVFETWLRRQHDDGQVLASQSDLLDLVAFRSDRFMARFSCRGLVRHASGAIVEADAFSVGIWFPSDYLRTAPHPAHVLTWLGPREIWHPNISSEAPLICVGHLAPGTSLVDLLYQVFEIITWRKVTMREDDALNREACQWARNHPSRYPVDRRPLKHRTLDLLVEETADPRRSHDVE